MRDTPIPGSRVTLRTRYAETDQMGRAHHMHYLAWFELGRTELMRANGISYAELEKTGILLPVARASVEYRQGVVYDEEVVIGTRLVDVRSRSVGFAYEARRRSDGSLVALGNTLLVCTNAQGRPRRIPPAVLDELRRLWNEMNRNGS